MPKVYITQDLGHINFVPAEAFGECEVLIFGQKSHLALAREIPRLYQKLKHLTEDDWIVACGHPFFIAAVSAIQAKRLNKVRMLYWDRQTQQYIKIEAEV